MDNTLLKLRRSCRRRPILILQHLSQNTQINYYEQYFLYLIITPTRLFLILFLKCLYYLGDSLQKSMDSHTRWRGYSVQSEHL